MSRTTPSPLRRRACLALFAAASLGLPGSPGAWAQNPPPGLSAKPLRIVAPYSAGSGVDLIARVYAKHLGEVLNLATVVENRDGAGGMIGSAYVAKQPADGHTLLVATTPFVVGPISQGNTSYDPLKDFAPLAQLAINPLALTINSNLPIKSMAELVAYTKANPDKLTYASSGPGTPSQLEMEALKARLGMSIREIPYKSNAQALADTIGGTVDMYYTVQSTGMSNVHAGKLRAIGVGSLKRTAALPDTPTIAEAANLPGYESLVWYGLVAPAGTPAAAVKTLSEAINKVTHKPEVMEEMKKLGFESSPTSPEEFRKIMAKEAERATAALRAAKK